MKKVILLFAAIAVVFVGCQDKMTYTINGKVSDKELNGKYIYLQHMTDGAMEFLDSTLVTEGAFKFKGKIENSDVYFLSFKELMPPQKNNSILFFLEPGTIEVVLDSVSSVSGTSMNEVLTDFLDEQDKFKNRVRALSRQYDDAATTGTLTDSLDNALNASYEKAEGEIQSYNLNFIKNNINNNLGKYVFKNSATTFKPEQQKEILNLADADFKEKPQIKRIVTRLENFEKVAEGNMFVDFTLENPKAEKVSLSNYAGKGSYVLVDFWASWCRPCLNEIPNLKETYKIYKNKGFEIVGISLDGDYESWANAIDKYDMNWIHMSDLKKWKSEVVDLYAINGIPHTVLLDKEGKIIAKDLRGNALKEKLHKLMP